MKSWSQARHDCVQEGGDLVSITSAAEQQYVTGILGTSHLDIWIGFSTLVRGISLSYLTFKISILCIGVKLGFNFFFQKCNKISCEVQAGNTQFAWSDAQTAEYENWATDEPTVWDITPYTCLFCKYLCVLSRSEGMFSSSDAQAGSCSAVIKDETDEFGKWKAHACRYERPYMCKRLLNSKRSCFGNTLSQSVFIIIIMLRF